MRKVFSLTCLVALFFVSCDNEDASQDDSNISNDASLVNTEVALEATETVLDNVIFYSEGIFGISAIANSIQAKGPGRNGRSGFFGDCVDITVEETDIAETITIVFNGSCEDQDGNVITGTITKVVETTDTSRASTVTITDVTVNGFVINGTKSYTFNEANANGNPEMVGSVDISVVTTDGTVTKVGTRTVEVTAGGDTMSWFDDEKTITGASTYTDVDGSSFIVEITTPLVRPAECRYIASGVKTYTDNDGTTTLDYGDGTCDNVATQTDTDGTVTEVTLRRRRM